MSSDTDTSTNANTDIGSVGITEGDPSSGGDDPRTPSPPYGYSRPCTLDRDQQIAVVAQFHANHIRPNRIAYRMGIDIALIEALIAGEEEPARFMVLVERYRRQRYRDRMRDSAARRGSGRYELQQAIEQEFQRELTNTAPPPRN